LVTSNLLDAPCLKQLDWPEFGPVYRGKVRDCFWRQDWGVIVTTDRISAFDAIFPQAIPLKGAVLQSMAVHFLKLAESILPTHLLEVPDPNAMIVKRARPIPLELVIRGYLTGSAWRDYEAGIFEEKYAQKLPPGMVQHQKLDQPLITPTSKEHNGHDQPLSLEEARQRAEGRWDEIEETVRALFEQGQAWAAQRQLTLVDCKYELGLIQNRLVLIDELHTPDSSRYWKMPLTHPPLQMSKEFFREWLLQQGAEGPIDIPDPIRQEIALRYCQLHRELLGRELELPCPGDPQERIRQALLPWKDRS